MVCCDQVHHTLAHVLFGAWRNDALSAMPIEAQLRSEVHIAGFPSMVCVLLRLTASPKWLILRRRPRASSDSPGQTQAQLCLASCVLRTNARVCCAVLCIPAYTMCARVLIMHDERRVLR